MRIFSPKSLLSLTLAAAAIATAFPAPGQDEPVDGMRPTPLRTHAITDTAVVIRPGERLERATVVIRDGKIVSVGPDVEPPRDARVWPGEGLTVYPGLIDAAVLVEVEDDEARTPRSHWNDQVRPEVRIADTDEPGASLSSSLRELGFTAAAVYPEDGVFRGSGAVVSLAGDEHEPIVHVDRAAMAVGFDRGRGYPSSLMGSIALFRQVIHDARWYEQTLDVWTRHPEATEPPATRDSLAALKQVINARQQVLVEVDDERNFLRAAGLIDEFGLDGVVLGSGMEFRRLREVASTGLPIVLPVSFPARPDVSTLDAADSTTLRTLLTWEQAPTNPARLLDAGATIALTTHGLDKRGAFFSNLRRAIANGLSEDAALAALTTTPAEMLGVERILGTVEPGKVANLVVVEGSLFDREMKVRDTWVAGRRYEINAPDEPEYLAAGDLRVVTPAGRTIEAPVDIDTAKNSVVVSLGDDSTAKAKKVTFDGKRLSFLLDGRLFGAAGYAHFAGAVTEGGVSGSGATPDRERFVFTITPTEGARLTRSSDDEDTDDEAAGEPGAADGDDGVAGEWAIMLEAEQMPGEAMPVTLELRVADDSGNITGSLTSEFFNADVTGGAYDPDTGAVSLTVSGSGMTTTIEGTIAEGQITGAVTGEGFSAQLTGSRAVARAGGGKKNGRKAREEQLVADPDAMVHPLGAFGLAEPPQPQSVIITNATIWTAGPEGIIENGWMVVADGKIAGLGSGMLNPEEVDTGEVEDWLVINADGRHITPGLIDAHSHTGIDGGVNEFSQVVTAEVGIEDVVDPDDINWYRQLAGGLTAANQLHGSANPIGGKNSIVKLKWSGAAEDFIVDDAAKGIKFALGENVKRSQSRYPNTRMGVATVIRDAFTAARDYRETWDRYRALSSDERRRTMPPRRDLELEALVQILEDERDIHCHSYRQDEILSLIRIADEFGFTVGTLQHILEGYKVAEAIEEHGAMASSFSDWWAYKVEVMDAIPYNGALLHDVGVIVSFNSDSSELARRMNTEAAKAVRYGGVEPNEALKFVTLNAAKQLGIDHRTGSLEVGKDADFAIWSGSPLSTYSRCEQTWIEGARYFSIQDDRMLRERARRERERLIQTILSLEHGEVESASDEEETAEQPAAPKDNPAATDPEAAGVVPGECVSRTLLEAMRLAAEQSRAQRRDAALAADEFSCEDLQ